METGAEVSSTHRVTYTMYCEVHHTPPATCVPISQQSHCQSKWTRVQSSRACDWCQMLPRSPRSPLTHASACLERCAIEEHHPYGSIGALLAPVCQKSVPIPVLRISRANPWGTNLPSPQRHASGEWQLGIAGAQAHRLGSCTCNESLLHVAGGNPPWRLFVCVTSGGYTSSRSEPGSHVVGAQAQEPRVGQRNLALLPLVAPWCGGRDRRFESNCVGSR